jgi:hypothetical protein
MNYYDEAKEVLRGNWTKQRMVSRDGSMCLAGGVNQAVNSEYANAVRRMRYDRSLDAADPKTVEPLSYIINTTNEAAYRLGLWETLGEVILENYPERIRKGVHAIGIVSTFNDHPDTTEEEALAMLEKASARWDEQV